jgi:hypothetical protein
LGEEMDTPIIISAISTLIACFSLWVAHKASLHSRESRKADKYLELRIRVVELRGKAEALKYNSRSLSKSQPTDYDQNVSDKLNNFFDLIDALHKKLYEDPSHLSEKDINDATISIRNIESELDFESEKIKNLL